MKNNIIIVLLFALCFGFKAQAQIAKVISLEDMQKSPEGKSFSEKLYAPSSRLVLVEGQDPIYSRPEDGAVKVVDVQAFKNIDLLKSPAYAKAVGTAEILLINLNLQEAQRVLLQQEHLKGFTNLKYMVVRSYDKLDEDRVRSFFRGLFSAEGIDLVYITLEEAS